MHSWITILFERLKPFITDCLGWIVAQNTEDRKNFCDQRVDQLVEMFGTDIYMKTCSEKQTLFWMRQSPYREKFYT